VDRSAAVGDGAVATIAFRRTPIVVSTVIEHVCVIERVCVCVSDGHKKQGDTRDTKNKIGPH
jgi:hypothetical protein